MKFWPKTNVEHLQKIIFQANLYKGFARKVLACKVQLKRGTQYFQMCNLILQAAFILRQFI